MGRALFMFVMSYSSLLILISLILSSVRYTAASDGRHYGRVYETPLELPGDPQGGPRPPPLGLTGAPSFLRACGEDPFEMKKNIDEVLPENIWFCVFV